MSVCHRRELHWATYAAWAAPIGRCRERAPRTYIYLRHISRIVYSYPTIPNRYIAIYSRYILRNIRGVYDIQPRSSWHQFISYNPATRRAVVSSRVCLRPQAVCLRSLCYSLREPSTWTSSPSSSRRSSSSQVTAIKSCNFLTWLFSPKSSTYIYLPNIIINYISLQLQSN